MKPIIVKSKSFLVNILFYVIGNKFCLQITMQFRPFPLMQMLRSFNVKMLVLSAIPELVSTWVSGFGFKPIQDAERKQLHSVNLMLFPGTSLLTKRLDGSIMTKKPGRLSACFPATFVPSGLWIWIILYHVLLPFVCVYNTQYFETTQVRKRIYLKIMDCLGNQESILNSMTLTCPGKSLKLRFQWMVHSEHWNMNVVQQHGSSLLRFDPSTLWDFMFFLNLT